MVIWVSSSVSIAGAIKGMLNWFPESVMLIHFLYHAQLWFEWELDKNVSRMPVFLLKLGISEVIFINWASLFGYPLNIQLFFMSIS